MKSNKKIINDKIDEYSKVDFYVSLWAGIILAIMCVWSFIVATEEHEHLYVLSTINGLAAVLFLINIINCLKIK